MIELGTALSERLTQHELDAMLHLVRADYVFKSSSVEALLTEIEELHADLDAADQTIVRLEGLQGDHSMAIIKIANMDRQIDELQTELHRLTEAEAVLLAQKAELELENEALYRETSCQESRLIDCLYDEALMMSKVQKLRSQMADKNKEIKRLHVVELQTLDLHRGKAYLT